MLGLAVALGVALYITKVPVPFINKVPQRTAEQDAEEAVRNKNWDPNAPLAGKAGAKAASGVVSPSPAPAPAAVAPVVTAPAQAPAVAPPQAAAASKPADKPAAKTDAKADPYLYFVQAGAYTRAEDADQQRARLAMLGFIAKVAEREQSGRTVFRVRVGPIDARDEAESTQRKIEAAGFEANLVRVER
ncbi:MAG: SPOR domain-containing protein [Burkholderiaceae bacterium]